MNGKSKCKILKSIRKKIAQDNNITYVTSECKYQGDCSGTCPKCEAELRYLEDELAKLKSCGKAVAVAGIAAALVIGSAGCDSEPLNRRDDTPTTKSTTNQTAETQPTTTDPQTTTLEIFDGVMYVDDNTQPTTTEYEELLGKPVLMGDMPMPEDYQTWD